MELGLQIRVSAANSKVYDCYLARDDLIWRHGSDLRDRHHSQVFHLGSHCKDSQCLNL